MALTPVTAHWKLDETSGNAIDSSGNGYTLTNFNSTPYAPAKLGNGAVFLSSASRYMQSSSLTIPAAFGISFWFYATNGGNYEHILNQGVSPSNAYIAISFVGDNKIHYSNLSSNEIISDIAFVNNTWNHCVITNNGSNVGKIYMNGVLAKSGAVNHSASTGILTLGRRNDVVGNYLNGMQDEVTIFPFEPTADEVSQLFNSGRGNAYPFTATPSLYGAIASYMLDSDSNDAINNLNGTDTNVSYANAGKIGNCATYSGSATSYTTLPTESFAPTGDFSIDGWFNVQDINQHQALHGKGDGTSNYTDSYLVRIGDATKKLNITLLKGVRNIGINSNTILNSNTWYHYVFTRNSSNGNMKLYINGILDNSVNDNIGTINTSNKPWRLGRFGGSTAIPLNGSLDLTNFWYRELSATDAATLYNGGAGLQYPFSTSTPIGFYPMINLLGQGQIF